MTTTILPTTIPLSITTPNVVETRLGTLRFFDGLPDEATVEMVYDNLDFQRGVQAFSHRHPGGFGVCDAHGNSHLRRGQSDGAHQ